MKCMCVLTTINCRSMRRNDVEEVDMAARAPFI